MKTRNIKKDNRKKVQRIEYREKNKKKQIIKLIIEEINQRVQ